MFLKIRMLSSSRAIKKKKKMHLVISNPRDSFRYFYSYSNVLSPIDFY